MDRDVWGHRVAVRGWECRCFTETRCPSPFRPRGIRTMDVSAVLVKLVDASQRQRWIQSDAIQGGCYEAAIPSPCPARRPIVITFSVVSRSVQRRISYQRGLRRQYVVLDPGFRGGAGQACLAQQVKENECRPLPGASWCAVRERVGQSRVRKTRRRRTVNNHTRKK